ncbi:hypothetical protein V6N13_104772 [Hibiscus sabdariffa]
MVAGQSTKVSTHKSGSSKNHVVVSIVEKGHGDSVRAGIQVHKQKVGGSKNAKTIPPSKGVGTKSANSGALNPPVLQDWVQHISNKIVEIGNQVGSAGTGLGDPTNENVSVLVVPSDPDCVMMR